MRARFIKLPQKIILAEDQHDVKREGPLKLWRSDSDSAESSLEVAEGFSEIALLSLKRAR